MEILTTYEQARDRFYLEAPGYKPASPETEKLVVVAFQAGYNAAVIDAAKQTAKTTKP